MPEIAKAPFKLELAGNRPQITRELEWKNGDHLHFTITLEPDDNATIVELHQRSVRELIDRLEAWIAPE